MNEEYTALGYGNSPEDRDSTWTRLESLASMSELPEDISSLDVYRFALGRLSGEPETEHTIARLVEENPAVKELVERIRAVASEPYTESGFEGSMLHDFADIPSDLVPIRDEPQKSQRKLTAFATPILAGVVVLISLGAAYQQLSISELQSQIELAGVRGAMLVSLTPSGRDTVAVEGSFDVRYVDGVTLTIRDKPIDLGNTAKLDKDRLRKYFQVAVPVDLNGQSFTASVKFSPKPDARELGEWFGEDRLLIQRDFLASFAGLIADPKQIRIPAEFTQIVYMLNKEDSTRDQNRYVVTGRTFEQVQGMHGWLVIDPTFGGNMFVGSGLSLDVMSSSPFMARCFLGGSGKPDGEPFRLFCVFSKDPEALRDGQELPRNFDWTGFVRTPSKCKINDGTDGFDEEQESPASPG